MPRFALHGNLLQEKRRMSKRITWHANALICAIIVLGFALTSYISYHSNREAFERGCRARVYAHVR